MVVLERVPASEPRHFDLVAAHRGHGSAMVHRCRCLLLRKMESRTQDAYKKKQKNRTTKPKAKNPRTKSPRDRPM